MAKTASGEEDHPVEQALVDRLVLRDIAIAAVAHIRPSDTRRMTPRCMAFRKGALPSTPRTVIQLFDE
jgi:hypothetical protein